MLIQCPHCYTKVMPKPDGSCPACQKDTADLRGTDPTRHSLRLLQGTSLPGICCDCGEETDRYFIVSCTSSTDRDQLSGFAQSLIALLVSWPMALYFFLLGIQNRTVVRIRMPQCHDCALTSPPKPRYVDYGNARMTFVVHNNLYQAVIAAEEDQAAE